MRFLIQIILKFLRLLRCEYYKFKVREEIRKEVKKVLSEYFSFRKMDFNEMMISQYDDSDFETFLKNSISKETIDEGLIKSQSPDLAYQIFRRIAEDSNVTYIKQRGSFFINILNLEDSSLQRLFNSFKQMGYFISEIITINKGESDSEYKSFKYSEEALKNILSNKNDLSLLSIQVNGYYINKKEDVPKLLYHITKKSLVEKINKQGLIPKSKSKKVYHPERVYFAIDFYSATALKKDFEKYYNDGMVLLTISTEKLKGVDFYEDPDFSKFGVYTLDNIPPSAIIDFKEI